MSDDDIACDEFVCEACGFPIASFPPKEPPPTRCSLCLWLDTYIEDVEERERLRKRLC